MFRGTMEIYLEVATLFGRHIYYELGAQHFFATVYEKKKDCIV